ncbi:ergothioneine biosynthesis protein EgtB [Solwaraspora sp. WMMB335]|uniref:ergothioneine biosynthesis protein EgtB n=1 Tax=Solwaraspora sp. WMMB335 TaxID=3404118 RepID=UPI003B96563B
MRNQVTDFAAGSTAARTADQVRSALAGDLDRARRRSRALTDPVDDGDLTRQHSPLMSPLVWDLAHIGNQEELWLVRDVGGREPVRADIDHLYDAFKHARAVRPTLPLLDPTEARAYTRTVRDQVLDLLDTVSFDGRPLVEQGFAFGMIVQHEQQHDETMLATHQLRAGPAVLTAQPPPAAVGHVEGEALIPAGPFTMGTSTEPWALDNERPAHTVDVPAFWIDRVPVTNAQYQQFVDDDGYHDQRWWSTHGWAYRQRAGLTAPMHWHGDGSYSRFGRRSRIVPDEPVVHVCWYEAEAYANWAGRRLPTEAEWEKTARFDPTTGRSSRYPWGDDDPRPEHANLGQRHLAPAPVGAHPAGASPSGVHQLIGDVWEWTATWFDGYPGFTAFPYREYSEVFFGRDYRVLRGGSFGTDRAACRGTFRNWDYPIRRQIFSGFRTARDPLPGEAG